MKNKAGKEYGGKHFIPYSTLDKYPKRRLRSDKELGFFDQDYPDKKCKFKYDQDEFYDAMGTKEFEIFVCIENGKLYIPGTRTLFICEVC